MQIVLSTLILFLAVVLSIRSLIKNDLTDHNSLFTKKHLAIFVGALFVVCILSSILIYSLDLYGRNYDRSYAYDRARDDNGSKDSSPTMEAKPARKIEILTHNNVKTRFKDVAGLAEAKDEVMDVIKFLNNPEHFKRLGAKSPKGLLLYGPPGTGKTLLARAIAGEAGVSFIGVAGSQFDEEYVGVGAARIRELFNVARQNAPCIIFIDEMDAVAFKRRAKDPAWSAQTINQLLAELDGLNENANENIVLIGATNRMNVLDPAILRPGRLDRHIKIDLPTLQEREQILSIYLEKIVTGNDINAHTLAKMTPRFSAAELSNLVNEAAILATKTEKDKVSMKDFDEAKDRVVMGSKNSSLKMSAEELKLTAYHEAGHALIGHLLNKNKEGNRSLYKVTIAPRGPSLGHTAFESGSTNDETSVSYQELNTIIATCLGGRVAEELVFGANKITTGASSDLQHASNTAYNMITKWGYSNRIGLVNLDGIGTNIIPNSQVLEEVQHVLNKNLAMVRDMLKANRKKLDELANALLEHETLDNSQVDEILSKT